MHPSVAVLSLTRDRLSYTQHCFRRLREFAGIPFDHYVFDQGSQDGTAGWLRDVYRPDYFALSPDNVGISRGMNKLLDATKMHSYDVIVKFDNDCELVEPDTLRDVARLTFEGNCLLSPRILGLQNPPPHGHEFQIGDETIIDIPQIGGIFLAVPGHLYQRFRYDETNHMDDVQVCWWYRGQGGRCGYVKRLEAWHYETTTGQHARYPDYFARQVSEGKPL